VEGTPLVLFDDFSDDLRIIIFVDSQPIGAWSKVGRWHYKEICTAEVSESFSPNKLPGGIV
jgi:hypothetical protein